MNYSEGGSPEGTAAPADLLSSRGASRYEIVAIAASAGGISALRRVLNALPHDFAAAVVVVQHLDPNHASLLANIFKTTVLLPVKQADENDIIEPGHIYIAPPNRHLLVSPKKTLQLDSSEPVHFLRPAADRLFLSMANTYKVGAIAVVLTGTGTDGAAGVAAVKDMGGTVIVQDEETSEFFGMPRAAIATGKADYVLPLSDIPQTLVDLVTGAK